VVAISPLIFYTQYGMIGVTCMEQKTIFIHREKNELNNDASQEHRVVTFINGNQDIMQIIKELIKNKYKS
jgi:hypothetical protein